MNEKIIDLTKAPDRGIWYAVYTDRIEYTDYEKNETTILADNKLLELHIFDDTREFRVIRRRDQSLIEKIIFDVECASEDTYEETIYVNRKGIDNASLSKEQVTVVNYIEYDDNDLLKISNYRLKETKRK